MRQLATIALALGAEGHGWINEPPSRTGATLEAGGSCPYGACMWFGQSCTIGCKECLGSDSRTGACRGSQGKATLPDWARTYDLGKACGKNPWCAPGSAPVMSPCGVAGGDVKIGKYGNGGIPPPGYAVGFDGTKLAPLAGERWKRTYKAGDTVDMAWSFMANHGGGYQYRLCPKAGPLTEECFQQTPLEFSGDEQYIQYAPYQHPTNVPNPGKMLQYFLGQNITAADIPPEQMFPVAADLTNRTAIPAVTVSNGTVPAGSQWRRNPIPGCKGKFLGTAHGGSLDMKCGDNYGHDDSDYHFPPAGVDLWRRDSRNGGGRFPLGGFGVGSCEGCSPNPSNQNQKQIPLYCTKDKPNGPVPGEKSIPKNCTSGFDADGVPDGTPDEYSEHLIWFSILDKVRIPKVPPGEYVVSFRWDCEQTPQIWNSCSDVTITA